MNRTRMLICTVALAALAALTTSGTAATAAAVTGTDHGRVITADRWCC